MSADRVRRGAVYALAVILPLELPSPLVRVMGLELTVLELAAAAALGVVATALLRRQAWREVVGSPLMGYALAFVCVSLVSTWLAQPPRLLPLKYTLRTAAGVTALALVSMTFRDARHLRTLLGVFAAVGTFVSLVSLAEAAGAPGIDSVLSAFRPQQFEVGGVRRAAATFSYPNTAAGFLLILLPAGLYCLWEPAGGSRRVRAAGWISSTLMFTAIVLTYSRGALLGALSVPVLLRYWAQRLSLPELRWRATALTVLFIALAGAVALTDPLFRLRSVSEGDAGWYRAEFFPEGDALTASARELVRFPIRVRNSGRLIWQRNGPKAFHLSYHWYDPEREKVLPLEGERTQLPRNVAPGEEVKLDAYVRAPAREGNYLLVWDMVQEHTTWFVGKGAGGKVLPVVVRGGDLPRSDARGLESGTLEDKAQALLGAAWFPGRLELWSLALKMFARQPLVGVGPDNFRWLYGPLAGRARWDERVYSNSLYLEILATTGLLGALAFFALVGSAGAALWRTAASRVGISPLAVVLLCALTGFLVHGVFDFLLEPTGMYLAFYMVLGAASGTLALSKMGSSPEG